MSNFGHDIVLMLLAFSIFRIAYQAQELKNKSNEAQYNKCAILHLHRVSLDILDATGIEI